MRTREPLGPYAVSKPAFLIFDHQLCFRERLFSSQSPLGRIKSVELTVTLDPRVEFVEILCAGLLGDAPQRPHIDLVV